MVGGKDTLNPAWLSERFPTEIRASASGFVYHQGAIGGLRGAVADLLAVDRAWASLADDGLDHAVIGRAGDRRVSGAGDEGQATVWRVGAGCQGTGDVGGAGRPRQPFGWRGFS